jgi:serine/threonine protein kinase
MSARQGSSSSIEAPTPPRGTCPACGKEPGGERCTHCGVAARVGPYRVRKVLGQRGAARTYLADDVDGLVVLKELSFITEPDAATLAAFHQEARQLQALTHPRIPRYLDMLQLGTGVDTRLYLAQEFIEGTSLEVTMSKRRATELEARETARQVLDILHYLQGRSPPVFHGDIKPANLICRPDGALFLVDFGAAWVRGDTDVEPSRYTPPDQPAAELNAATDFYALGVTLVDALTWEPQWKQRAAGPEALASHVDVSPSFREFLARLTAPDSQLRFRSATEALRDLEAPELATPAPASRRRVWPVVVGAIAALLLFAAGFVTGRVTQPLPPWHGHHGHVDYKHYAVEDKPVTPRPRAPVPTPARSTDQLSADKASIADTVTPQTPLRRERVLDHEPLACELAGLGTTTASRHMPDHAPWKAVDRNLDTAWRSDTSSSVWLQVDLGQPHTVDSLVYGGAWMPLAGARAQGKWETSVDGWSWKPLINMSSHPSQHGLTFRVSFPARTVQYVRFFGMGSTAGEVTTGGEVAITSLELYGPECPLSSSRYFRMDETSVAE